MRRRDVLQGLATVPLAGALLGNNRAAATEVKQDSTALTDPLYDPKLHLFLDDHGVLRSQNVIGIPISPSCRLRGSLNYVNSSF